MGHSEASLALFLLGIGKLMKNLQNPPFFTLFHHPPLAAPAWRWSVIAAGRVICSDLLTGEELPRTGMRAGGWLLRGFTQPHLGN